ncbi:DMT family transporter [Bacillus aquiflavi]|uniref:DMT family transporter n=1 Tax=Bacillus aquiflavi TaxID=2672567 RepID=A0A6B3VZV0_9BACI|nr:DMT family transporter [Bacillus aquiflavi]MBA4536749.1 DMT family transporter [Bacillus aquiflavi]NEY81116.1 DMT family transporter [Bacillus aquiflavi]
MNAKAFFTHPLGLMISAAGAAFLWGSAFPFIKLSYEKLDIKPDEIGEQLLFAGYRFLLAGLLVYFIFRLLKKDMKLRRVHIVTLVKIGVVQTFFQYVFFYIGLSYSTGIQGSIIAGTTSLFQIIIAHFMYEDDRVNRMKSIGLLIGFSGVILVNLPKGDLQLSFGIGEILLLFAMVSGAYGNILARNGSQKMDVIYLTSYQMILGSLGLVVIGGVTSGFFPFTFDMQSFMILLYLAFLSAAGFILWNNVMKYNQVGKVSLYLFLIPVFGVILSAILLDETLHYIVFLGLALVVSGIIIVNRPAVKQQEKDS